jgi:hypothetical protein
LLLDAAVTSAKVALKLSSGQPIYINGNFLLGTSIGVLRTSFRELYSLMEQSDGPVRQNHLASSYTYGNHERSCGGVDEDVLGFYETYQITISMAIILS